MTIESDVLKAPEVTDVPSGYLETLIEQAQAVILEYTKLTAWPENDTNLDTACVRMVLHLYRKGGAEGTQSASIGDITANYFDIPPEVRTVINSRRRAGWL